MGPEVFLIVKENHVIKSCKDTEVRRLPPILALLDRELAQEVLCFLYFNIMFYFSNTRYVYSDDTWCELLK